MVRCNTQTEKVRGVQTRVEVDSQGYVVVRYHRTAVVQFNNEEIILNSGGWQTLTTKTRMNQASNEYGLGYKVYQRDYVWYVDFKGKTYLFQDGMVLKR